MSPAEIAEARRQYAEMVSTDNVILTDEQLRDAGFTPEEIAGLESKKLHFVKDDK